MANDIEITIRVSNQTQAGLTALNRSLRSLRDEARDSGQALTGLTARAVAAAAALRQVKDAAQDAARALRSLNSAAGSANGRLGDLSSRSRTLRSDSDDLDGSMRRLITTMGGLRGSMGGLPNVTANSGNAMDRLRAAAIPLATALIPIAAAAVPIAAGLAAATVAVGAFGVAVGGQVVAMVEASEAQEKYDKAVREHGKTSAEAAKAETEYVRLVKEMPAATREASAALSVMKDQYKGWSAALADSTMPVVTKSFAVFGALLPRLTPLVRGASSELDRLMTVLAGGVQSQGFERFMEKFSEFATGALRKATDGLVHFSRVLAGGAGGGAFTEFMAYVRDVGPDVSETLGNLGRALAHLVASASDVGVTMLAVVNAFAQLVNAIPRDFLSTMLQLVVVFKAVQIAAAGLAATSGAVTAFGASIIAMRTAAGGTTGRLTQLSAAFGALSRTGKAGLVAAGIGLVVVAISKLSNIGKAAPPDVDRLTSSLNKLVQTGVVAGEASRVFGKGLDGLYDSVRNITDPSTVDQIQNGFVKIFTLGQVNSTASDEAQKRLDAVDDALVKLVKGGHADLAAAALDKLAQKYAEGGHSAEKFRAEMDEHKKVLADQKLEQQLAAQAMGLFGEQALATSTKLAAQKQSADGLRQAIQALNDVNRAGLGGMIGFEAAIDAAAKAAKDNAGALSMTGGKLDLNGEKARDAASALQDLAAKTDAVAGSARESGASWGTLNGIYERGREQFIASARAMGLSTAEAKLLASQIMKIPNSKATKFEMRTEDAITGLNSVISAMKKTPNSKSVVVKALTKDAVGLLRDLGFKVQRMKDGRFKITADTKTAKGQISDVQRARDGLKNKTITLAARDRASAAAREIRRAIDALRSKTVTITTVRAVIAKYSTVGRPSQGEGGVSKYAQGGEIVGGSGTRDDVPIMAMGGEFVVNKASARKYRRLLEAVNEDRLPRFARGGRVGKAERAARAELVGQFDVSRFGRIAGGSTDPFERALGKPSDLRALVSALNGFRGRIKAAFSGRVEASLLRGLDAAGRALIRHEKALSKVTDQLDKARSKLADLRGAAAQLASSVKSGVLGSANVTRGAGEGRITTGRVIAGLAESQAKASDFAAALGALRRKGLDKSLIAQIAEAGIEGGGLETATALRGASKSEITSINQMQQQISKAAAVAGKVTADAMYGAQIKAQERLVRGLNRQQERLEKAMSRLATAMERAIQRAIRGRASGGIVGAASGGARGGVTWVGEQGPELVRLPFGSRVRSAGDSRRLMGGGGGGGSRLVELVINLDGRTIARQIFDPLRGEVRDRGGIAALGT